MPIHVIKQMYMIKLYEDYTDSITNDLQYTE